MPRTYFVYILANKPNTSLYIGVTNNLLVRVKQHRDRKIEGFTKRYHVDRLVYFEEYSDIRDAIAREKQLKKWNRAWKDELIDSVNPTRQDLFLDP